MTIHGLVLVGGQSSRMGEAKAHLRLNNIPQWQRAHDVLVPICEQVYFSVSPRLGKPIPVAKSAIIRDQVEACGPLGGIISAFKQHPTSAWFVLACDMPFFDYEAASSLIKQRNINKFATCYENSQGQPEPLCALYESAIFSYLLKSWAEKIYCPQNILASVDIQRCKPIPENIISNINYPHEWLEIRQDNISNSCEVTITYYASLREARGCAQETIATDAQTMRQLFNQLAYKYNFDINEKSLRFAKNNQLVGPEEIITHGDSIVLIPPVSGG